MNHPDCSWLISRPVAHRGYHDKTQGIVENCKRAFERAIEHNFSIECDVQITADGKAVVFHDYELERLTHGTGRIDAQTLESLQNVDFRDGPDHIMELSEMLAFVDGRVPLVIELKTPAVHDGRLERAVANAIEGYDGKLALMSFSPKVVEALIPLTDRPRGITGCDYLKSKDFADMSEAERYAHTHLLHAPQTRPDFVSYCVNDFPMGSLDLLRALYDMPVICWTTRSPESHAHAMKFCDQVTFEGYNPDDLT